MPIKNISIKNVEQMLKLHRDFTDRLDLGVPALVRARTDKLPLDALLKEKELRVSTVKAELEKVISERDAVVRQWDERISRSRARLAQLEDELSKLKEQIKHEEKPVPAPAEKADKTPGRPPRKRS